MIEIFVVISLASTFAKLAFDKNFNRYVWGGIAVGSYIIGQVLMGFIVAATQPSLLDDKITFSLLGIPSGLIGVGIAYIILRRLPEKRDNNALDRDLLDGKID
jgi:hypothetical protein